MTGVQTCALPIFEHVCHLRGIVHGPGEDLEAKRLRLLHLLRIEIAETDRPTDRADEISRWVMAETTPLSLPDGRWDKMAYGVRDCEEFLRAIS